MNFVVDAQLPPALAQLLVDKGHDAEHVADIGLRDAKDTTISHYALAHEAIIVTKDEDFSYRQSQAAPRTAPAILWLRVGNASRRALLQWFEPLLLPIEVRSEQGERLVEVR